MYYTFPQSELHVWGWHGGKTKLTVAFQTVGTVELCNYRHEKFFSLYVTLFFCLKGLWRCSFLRI